MAGPSQERRRSEMFDRLQVGDVVRGTVSGLTSYGAFVQISDAPGPHLWGDGLIHVSELAWGPVRQVTDVVQLGEQVAMKVIRLDRERDQIMLSLRQVGGDQHVGASLI